jgi:hypothetical protein
MDVLTVLSENVLNPTVGQRIELILDLTRRVELLEDLLSSARAKRCAMETDINLTEVYQAEIDSMIGEYC